MAACRSFSQLLLIVGCVCHFVARSIAHVTSGTWQMKTHRSSLLATLAAILHLVTFGLIGGGCAVYDRTPRGTINNGDRIWLVWAGPDDFIYVPDPQKPFSFTRAASRGGKTITPGAMYTDGGS